MRIGVTGCGWGPALATGLATLALLASAAPAVSGERLARREPAKPAATRLGPGDATDRIVVKFREGTGLRRRQGRLVAPAGVDARRVEATLRSLGVAPRRLRRLFARSEGELDADRARARARSHRELADLNLYYSAALPAGSDIAAVCDALNALPEVELAAPAPRPTPPPGDLAPTTPDLSPEQGYRELPPRGVGAVGPGVVAGADGAGVQIADIEYSWTLDHEDLELGPEAWIDVGTPDDPFPADEGSHGTAVLAVLGSGRNAYGTTGIVPAATLRVAAANTVEYDWNVGRAIDLAAAASAPGDVVLVEQQMAVCGLADYGPVEWWQPWYDAIAQATALGVVVVEAAGNGGVDLDATACQGRFDRSVRDSGAILVGAGHRDTHVRLSYSSYGSRVDLQGWGHLVATAGYGSRFDPGDVRQRYTGWFSGTSSAAPMVAAAAAAVQGALLADGQGPLAPTDVRALLVATGTPEGSPVEGIGPLPRIPHALAQLGLLACEDPDADGVCEPLDNCLGVANASQLDTDADGYGNACDADYNQDGHVGMPDWLRVLAAYGSLLGDPRYDAAVDVNGDGAVGEPEYILMHAAFGGSPGPSGLACAGVPPCRAGDL